MTIFLNNYKDLIFYFSSIHQKDTPIATKCPFRADFWGDAYCLSPLSFDAQRPSRRSRI